MDVPATRMTLDEAELVADNVEEAEDVDQVGVDVLAVDVEGRLVRLQVEVVQQLLLVAAGVLLELRPHRGAHQRARQQRKVLRQVRQDAQRLGAAIALLRAHHPLGRLQAQLLQLPHLPPMKISVRGISSTVWSKSMERVRGRKGKKGLT